MCFGGDLDQNLKYKTNLIHMVFELVPEGRKMRDNEGYTSKTLMRLLPIPGRGMLLLGSWGHKFNLVFFKELTALLPMEECLPWVGIDE